MSIAAAMHVAAVAREAESKVEDDASATDANGHTNSHANGQC